jgi:hypothetical protein
VTDKNDRRHGATIANERSGVKPRQGNLPIRRATRRNRLAANLFAPALAFVDLE